MRPSCPARRPHRARPGGHQQLVLVVDVHADPLLEVAAGEVLVMVLDELRAHGMNVVGVRVELDVWAGP